MWLQRPPCGVPKPAPPSSRKQRKMEASGPSSAGASPGHGPGAAPTACMATAGGAPAAGLKATTEVVVGSLPDDALRAELAKMKAQQAELRRQRLEVSRNLRNARKRQQRLRKRARLLSDEDLVQVLLMRKARKNDGEPFAAGHCKASEASSLAGGPGTGSGKVGPDDAEAAELSEAPPPDGGSDE